MISGVVTGRHTCSFIRLPCWLTDAMRICDVLTTSHFFFYFLCVLNNVVSHVMGQKARRTKPTSAEETETNGIKCFSTHFCCSSLSYHLKKMPLLVISTLAEWDSSASEGSVVGSVSAAPTPEAFYLNLHIYLYGWFSRTSRMLQFRFSWGEDKAAVFEDWL